LGCGRTIPTATGTVRIWGQIGIVASGTVEQFHLVGPGDKFVDFGEKFVEHRWNGNDSHLG